MFYNPILKKDNRVTYYMVLDTETATYDSMVKAVKGTNAKVEEQQSRVDDLMGKLNDVENKNSGNTSFP